MAERSHKVISINFKKYYEKKGALWLLRTEYRLGSDSLHTLWQRIRDTSNAHLGPKEIFAKYQITDKQLLNLFYQRFSMVSDRHGFSPYILNNHANYMWYLLDDYKGSIELFRKIISFDSAIPEAHNGLGKALYFDGQIDEAIKELRRAINLDPYNPTFYNDVSMFSFYNGNFDEGFKALKKAIELDPSFEDGRLQLSSIHFNLGIAYLEDNDYQNAISEFNKSLQEGSTNKLDSTYLYLGVSHLRTGDVEKALMYFNKAKEINPKILPEELQIELEQKQRKNNSSSDTTKTTQPDSLKKESSLPRNIEDTLPPGRGQSSDQLVAPLGQGPLTAIPSQNGGAKTGAAPCVELLKLVKKFRLRALYWLSIMKQARQV